MRQPTISANGVGAFLGLASFAVFSAHDVIVKHLGGTYSTFQIAFFSALFSFPIITLILIRDHQAGTLRPVHPWWIALRCVCGVASGFSALYAVSVLPLAQVYAFIFASPLIITLLAIPFLGETIRLRRGLAVVVGLLGVMIVLQPGAAPLTAGHIAALVCAGAGAMVAIIVRKIGKEERGVVMILYPMMTNLIVAGVALPFVYVAPPLDHLGLFAADAVLVLLGMSCLVMAYNRAAAIIVAPMQYSQIIWGALVGFLMFGEYPAWTTYAGAAVIIASGVYILRREASGGVSRTTPVLKTRTRVERASGLRAGDLQSGGRKED